MQRSWGRAVPGVLEGQPGGPRGWSRERGKVGGGKAREGTGQSYRALASKFTQQQRGRTQIGLTLKCGLLISLCCIPKAKSCLFSQGVLYILSIQP